VVQVLFQVIPEARLASTQRLRRDRVRAYLARAEGDCDDGQRDEALVRLANERARAAGASDGE